MLARSDRAIVLQKGRAVLAGVETIEHGLAGTRLLDAQRLEDEILRLFSGALSIRHVDAGSCNGCDIELLAALTPKFDVERFGPPDPSSVVTCIYPGGLRYRCDAAVGEPGEAAALGDGRVEHALLAEELVLVVLARGHRQRHRGAVVERRTAAPGGEQRQEGGLAGAVAAVVPPDFSFRVDTHGNILVTRR